MADSAKQFLVIDSDGKGHLPVRDSAGGPLNHHLMGAAWAALHGGYRGNKYEGEGKEAAIAKLKSLYKSEGMELPSTDSEVSSVKDADSAISLQTSNFPRFVALLADVPAAGLVRIPIAVTGTWAGGEKKFSIQLEDLEQIRENFSKKPTGEINVDYEHASEVPFGTGGPVLSAGRITKLDEPERFSNGNRELGMGNRETANSQLPTPNSRFILWGWYEPTERARELIANREYRYISPAIRWGTKDKVTGKTAGTTLTSVALVNKPFLEELPEIHLCDVQDAGFRMQDSGKTRTRTFVSLQQLHVPGPVNQISVAYGQPGNNEGSQVQESKSRKVEELNSSTLEPSTSHKGEKTMAKSLKLKCLTDAHLEEHDLPAEHKGKIGVFDGEELIGVADGPEGWEPTEAPQDQFTALSESIHDGKINLVEAGKLADAGRVRFSTILQAQEAERKVNAAVKAGKVLPKNRAHALKLALSDATAFTALVEQARPVVDLRRYGHAGGGEQPTAQQALMAEVNAYAKENKCPVSVALSEVTKRKPDLWREYSEEIVAVAESAGEEETE
jgi:hypothetical protein